MRKIILLLNSFFLYNCVGLSQIVDIGYKDDCLESYSDIIYGNLLPIIDSITLNELTKESTKFRVRLSFSTKTGYPNEILIIDSANILSNEKKEEYKFLLFKTQFYLCHSEHDVYKKPAKEVFTGKNAGIYTESFSAWWHMRMILRKE